MNTLKQIVNWLSSKPVIFNFLRRIIENNYLSLKRVIRKEIPSENHQRILDVPCGTGEFCKLFDASSYNGLDISERYINFAKKKYKRNFFCRDARNSEFPDSYFDKILVLGLLHHLDHTATEEVLKETMRILKKGGKMLLIEDSPVRSKWNFIGKLLQKLDVGSFIRTNNIYKAMLQKDFIIENYYLVNSGFWDYSVFVLLPK